MFKKPINPSKENYIIKSMNFLKNKAKTLDDIYNNSKYILHENIQISSEDSKLLDDPSKKIIKEFLEKFKNMKDLNKEGVENLLNELVKSHKTNFKGVGRPIRIGLVGSRFGPGIYNVILSLPKDEVINRLSKIT